MELKDWIGIIVTAALFAFAQFVIFGKMQQWQVDMKARVGELAVTLGGAVATIGKMATDLAQLATQVTERNKLTDERHHDTQLEIDELKGDSHRYSRELHEGSLQMERMKVKLESRAGPAGD